MRNVRMNMKQFEREKGFALLVAILISSVVLAVGLSMLNITLKQYVFSGIGRESEIAFYSADAGMECALYWDTLTAGGIFDIGEPSTVPFSCMGVSHSAPAGGSSGDTKSFEYEWTLPSVQGLGGQTVCAKISITKYFDASGPITSPVACDEDATCTQVESRGYNRSCAVVNTGSDTRIVERALRANY